MTNIIQLPRQKPTRGEIYCKAIDVTFPAISRVSFSMTAEILEQLGDMETKPSTFHLMVMDTTNLDPLGVEHCELAQHIRLGDQEESVLIRHHKSERDAQCFLDGITMMHLLHEEEGDPESANSLLTMDETLQPELCEVGGSFFTKNLVPTRKSWPGPMLIYQAEVPDERLREMEVVWSLGISPAGEAVELNI